MGKDPTRRIRSQPVYPLGDGSSQVRIRFFARLDVSVLTLANDSRAQKWEYKIPKALEDGEYLLRTELLGLHVAGK
jgi:hypothetical protein